MASQWIRSPSCNLASGFYINSVRQIQIRNNLLGQGQSGPVSDQWVVQKLGIEKWKEIIKQCHTQTYILTNF